MKNTQLLLISAVLVLLFSCTDKNKEERAHDPLKITLVNTNEQDLAAINQQLIKTDTAQSGLQTTAAKANLWTAFMRAFNNCFQDETFKKNVIYLGPSNSKYVGSILSRDKSITWKTLESAFGSNYQSAVKKIVNEGNPAPDQCQNSELLSNYVNVLMDGTPSEAVNGQLKLAIEDRRNIKMLTGRWRVDELVLGDFISYLDTAKSKSVADYKKYLVNNKNYLLTKVLIIENFSAEIESNRQLDAGLQAQLATGITTVIKSRADSADAKLNLTFSRGAQGSIKVTGTGKSLAIGMLQKVKVLSQ
jgi:hypothetical protein